MTYSVRAVHNGYLLANAVGVRTLRTAAILARSESKYRPGTVAVITREDGNMFRGEYVDGVYYPCRFAEWQVSIPKNGDA